MSTKIIAVIIFLIVVLLILKEEKENKGCTLRKRTNHEIALCLQSCGRHACDICFYPIAICEDK